MQQKEKQQYRGKEDMAQMTGMGKCWRGKHGTDRIYSFLQSKMRCTGVIVHLNMILLTELISIIYI